MTVARGFALVFGAIYVVVGLLGFIRPLTDAPGDAVLHHHTANLLGIFSINWFHNLAHIAIGALGLAAARQTNTSRLYAQAIGVAYAGLFVIGLFTGNFLDILPLNGPDNVLHLASAVVALAIGFSAIGLQVLGQRGKVMPSGRGA
jgi:hypothetical protein